MRVKQSLAGLLALLLGCGPAVVDHEALWAASGPTSYHYTYTTTGFAPRLALLVTVRASSVSSTTVISPPGGGGVTGSTVEQLFQDVRHRFEGPCETTVHYDQTLGYPLAAYSDCGMEGDGWTVTGFAADSAPDPGLP